MGEGYYQIVTAILKLHGFKYSGNYKGSHERWSNGTINVNVPFNLKSRFTAKGILKDAGINERI